jgi:anthranilate phosphoribosyltransferase
MKEQLAKVIAGKRLSEQEAARAMETIMDGQATPAQIGALLAALAVRGESEDEIVGFAGMMRGRAMPLRSQNAVDTCGTGGDGAGTYNISTLASLVVAACGVPVAKHGNRSASGRCGSADVLEALGVKIDPEIETVQRMLDEAGWTFLFAPRFHASTRHAVGPRKEMGVRTAFNLLGPLTNPAHPRGQVVGVPRAELTAFMARCLMRLGIERAWVVHGEGLDELSPTGKTTVAALEKGEVRTFTVDPESLGLARCAPADLFGGDVQGCTKIASELLTGGGGPRRDALLMNAAAALVVAERASDLRQGMEQAARAIDDRHVVTLRERVREMSHV